MNLSKIILGFISCTFLPLFAHADDTAAYVQFCVSDPNPSHSRVHYVITPGHIFYNDGKVDVRWASEGGLTMNDIQHNYTTKKQTFIDVPPHPSGGIVKCGDALFMHGQDTSMWHNTQVVAGVHVGLSSCGLDPIDESKGACSDNGQGNLVVAIDTQRIGNINQVAIDNSNIPYPNGHSCGKINATQALLKRQKCEATPGVLTSSISYGAANSLGSLLTTCYYITIPQK